MWSPLFPTFTRSAVCAAAIAAVVAPAWAQNTSASVAGRVTDAAGTPLAGATVTVLHRESGSTATTTTDAGGRYVARGLRVGGPYRITATQGGRTEVRDDVFLTLAETTALDLQVGAAQTIVVTGRSAAAAIDRNAMGAGTNLGSRELALNPSVRRDLQDYARLDPRVVQTDKEQGQISVAGQNNRFNSVTIDGVATSDTFGIEQNGLPTRKQPVSMDAIASVQINVSNYDVTQKGYTGANVNAVTKSGTNDFKGSVYHVLRNESLSGQRFNRTNGTYFDPADFEETTSGFTLGGPILKDKLFFFVSAEKFKSTKARPDFSALGGPGTNVAITPAAIDAATSIATNTWGMNIGTVEVPGNVAVEVKDTLLRLDWNLSDNHRATLRYNKTAQTEPQIVGFSASGLSMSSYWFTDTKTFDGVVGQWFADWSPAFSTEVKVSKRNYHSVPTAVNGTKLPEVTLAFSGALAGITASRNLLFGTERNRHFNDLRTDTVDAYVGANWSLGAHELKFGADLLKNDIYDPFVPNSNGQYRFACENSSATLTYQFTASPVVCGTVAGASSAAVQEQAALENFRRGRPSSYTLQFARSGFTLNDATATWSYRNVGFFLQDSWKLSDKLQLLVGARFDQVDVPIQPALNTAVAAAKVPGSINGNTIVRDSGGFSLDNQGTMDGSTLFQPRLGFNWDLGGPERRMQLRGGLGLFQGAAANVWLTNPFANTGVITATLSCSTFGACQTAGATFSPDPRSQPGLAGTPPAANVDALDRGLKQPAVWKANLAFESELPMPGGAPSLTAGIEWLHTRVDNSLWFEHLNLGAPTRTGPDGRQLFYTPQGYNPACWNGSATITTGACAGFRSRALSNPNFGNVYVVRNTDKGSGDAVTFSLGRPTANGFGWSVAYTHTRATEVSPLTNSTSNSTFQNRHIFNPNEDVVQNSNYVIKDRIGGNLTWAKAFVGNYRTSIGLFYEGRRGKPYAWTYINDMNGDGVAFNDLMYIPSGPGDAIFKASSTETAAQAEARFWQIVDSHPGLARAKGGVVGRNDSYAPWVNSWDMRISQELPAFSSKHRASLTLDILNIGNLFRKRWGRIDEIGFPSDRSFVFYNGIDPATGKYVYSVGNLEDFVTRQASGESQWAAQITLRYEF